MDGGKQLLVWRPRSAAVQPPATAGHGRPPLAAPRSSASKRVIVEESESHNNQSRGRRYVRGRLLGRGGFAAVYELRELAEGATRAKSCAKSWAGKVVSVAKIEKSATKRQQLECEIAIHRSLEHPNVLKFLGMFEDKEKRGLWMRLELCKCKTLGDMLQRRKRLTEPECKYFLPQIAAGLGYIHSQQVLHRDIKPANIFLDERMQIKLADFGLSVRLRPGSATHRRTFCGTPNYMAPEVIRQQGGHTAKSDVWAMGICCFAMLVGRPPFDSTSADATYRRILRSNGPAWPTNVRIGIRCRQLVEFMLEREPDTRASVAAVAAHPYLADPNRPRALPDTAIHTVPAFGPNGQAIFPNGGDKDINASRPAVLTQQLTQAQLTAIMQKIDAGDDPGADTTSGCGGCQYQPMCVLPTARDRPADSSDGAQTPIIATGRPATSTTAQSGMDRCPSSAPTSAPSSASSSRDGSVPVQACTSVDISKDNRLTATRMAAQDAYSQARQVGRHPSVHQLLQQQQEVLKNLQLNGHIADQKQQAKPPQHQQPAQIATSLAGLGWHGSSKQNATPAWTASATQMQSASGAKADKNTVLTAAQSLLPGSKCTVPPTALRSRPASAPGPCMLNNEVPAHAVTANRPVTQQAARFPPQKLLQRSSSAVSRPKLLAASSPVALGEGRWFRAAIEQQRNGPKLGGFGSRGAMESAPRSRSQRPTLHERALMRMRENHKQAVVR